MGRIVGKGVEFQINLFCQKIRPLSRVSWLCACLFRREPAPIKTWSQNIRFSGGGMSWPQYQSEQSYLLCFHKPLFSIWPQRNKRNACCTRESLQFRRISRTQNYRGDQNHSDSDERVFMSKS